MLPTLLLAASPSLAAAAQPPACTAGFTHPQKDGSLHFVYTQNTPNTFGPSAIDVPVTAVRCSPAGRIIIVTEGEDAPGDVPTHGAIGITIIDPASHRVLLDDFQHLGARQELMNHSCLWLVAFLLPHGTARAAVTDCNVWQLLPNSAPVLGTMTFTAPGHAATVKASVGADATILLFCDVPNGAGIAAVEWKP